MVITPSLALVVEAGKLRRATIRTNLHDRHGAVRAQIQRIGISWNTITAAVIAVRRTGAAQASAACLASIIKAGRHGLAAVLTNLRNAQVAVRAQIQRAGISAHAITSAIQTIGCAGATTAASAARFADVIGSRRHRLTTVLTNLGDGERAVRAQVQRTRVTRDAIAAAIIAVGDARASAAATSAARLANVVGACGHGLTAVLTNLGDAQGAIGAMVEGIGITRNAIAAAIISGRRARTAAAAVLALALIVRPGQVDLTTILAFGDDADVAPGALIQGGRIADDRIAAAIHPVGNARTRRRGIASAGFREALIIVAVGRRLATARANIHDREIAIDAAIQRIGIPRDFVVAAIKAAGQTRASADLSRIQWLGAQMIPTIFAPAHRMRRYRTAFVVGKIRIHHVNETILDVIDPGDVPPFIAVGRRIHDHIVGRRLARACFMTFPNVRIRDRIEPQVASSPRRACPVPSIRSIRNLHVELGAIKIGHTDITLTEIRQFGPISNHLCG